MWVQQILQECNYQLLESYEEYFPPPIGLYYLVISKESVIHCIEPSLLTGTLPHLGVKFKSADHAKDYHTQHDSVSFNRWMVGLLWSSAQHALVYGQ